jgi:aldose 1-epimerase
VIELTAGDASATVDVEDGGRLARLRVGGRELLAPPPSPLDASIRWGCFLMAPWPGRLAHGRLAWDGRQIQLRRTHGRHAIHGLIHGRSWDLVASTHASADLAIDLRASGWPFAGRVRQSIAIEPGGLRLEASIEADEPMPAALGWHPWFDRGDADPRLTVAGDRVLEVRGMIPTGRELPVAGSTDLRAGPRLGRRRLDHAYTGVRSPVVIEWPDLRLTVELAPATTTVVVHTPPRAFCVEPQTAWPNALAQPAALAAREGAATLQRGERLEVAIRLGW